MTGRGRSFAIALVAAIGAATVAGAATPAAHTVRIERAGDQRLDGLTSAIRAELLAAGFKIAPEKARAGSNDAAAESAVITVRADGARAVVIATVAGAAPSFSAEIAFTDAGAARRDVNRVALQVAEWLAAIWLPPPAPAPAPVETAAIPAPAPPSPDPVPAGPAALEPLAPPPSAPAPAAPALAEAAVRQARDPEPAAARIALLDFGVGVLAPPDFRAQSGFEIGAALHGTSPIVGGATPFVRLSLGLFWLGSGGAGSSSLYEWFDLNFASLTAATGLRLALDDNVSVEISAGVGLALIWFAGGSRLVDAGPATRAFSGETLVATPGGGLALINRFSQRWAVAAELCASWMAPRLVFVTWRATEVGDSSWPMLTGALALRYML